MKFFDWFLKSLSWILLILCLRGDINALDVCVKFQVERSYPSQVMRPNIYTILHEVELTVENVGPSVRPSVNSS